MISGAVAGALDGVTDSAVVAGELKGALASEFEAGVVLVAVLSSLLVDKISQL